MDVVALLIACVEQAGGVEIQIVIVAEGVKVSILAGPGNLCHAVSRFRDGPGFPPLLSCGLGIGL